MNYPGRIITVGEKNAAIVIAIQKRLNETGCGPIAVDGDFGTETLQAVKAFQSMNCDRFGNPLVIDGIIGPLTWASLFRQNSVEVVTSPKKLLNKVVEIAQQEVGVKEVPPGSNRGPRVEEYLRSVDRQPGDAWCAAFVYWCFEKAANELALKNPVYKTGHCMTHWNKTTGKKITKDEAFNNPSLLEPGFIFIINRGDGNGHTGLVKSIQDGYINTIEGNTNNDHSAEGVGVFELRRKINTITAGFIDYGE